MSEQREKEAEVGRYATNCVSAPVRNLKTDGAGSIFFDNLFSVFIVINVCLVYATVDASGHRHRGADTSTNIQRRAHHSEKDQMLLVQRSEKVERFTPLKIVNEECLDGFAVVNTKCTNNTLK